MALPPEVRLVALYTARYNRLRGAAGLAVGRAWDRTAGLDDVAAERFSDLAAEFSTAAQAQTAVLVDGYLGAMTGLVLGEGTTSGVDPTDVSGAAVRAGAEPADVYQRSIVTARTAISAGRTFEEAMTAGRARALATVSTDVALTQRATAAIPRDGIVGYRRVLTGRSCALCGTASTQRYHTASLLPLHSHCDCGIAPIFGIKDPGQVINKPLLGDLKGAGKATGDPDYWRSRKLIVEEDGTVRLPDVQIHEHGELGPVLTDSRHDFTAADEIAA